MLNAGQSPVAKMLESVELFNFAHVDLTVITCITAHNFIDDIISKSQAKVLNALLLTNEYICEKYSDKRLNIGILATNGSVYSGIFDRYLDFNLIYPGKNSQNMLMDAIYGNSEFNLRGIKGSNSHDISAEKAIIKGVANELIINGANLLLSACTEIPLALTSADVQMNIVNPMDVVIEYIIKNYK